MSMLGNCKARRTADSVETNGCIKDLSAELSLHAEAEAEAEDGQDDNDSTTSSVDLDQGPWEGDDDDGGNLPWRGCICGEIHARPKPVFWIRCDGACRSWYNVALDCVGFDAKHAEHASWCCPSCSTNIPLALSLLLDLPDALVYHILNFLARPRERAACLSLQIAPLCSQTWHAVQHEPWSGLWTLLLQEYANCRGPLMRSKRKRTHRRLYSCQELVCEAHLALSDRTEDAHMTLATTATSKHAPLTLKRLRCILKNDGELFVNRRSPSGRTFAMVCCAADYIDEGVILRCVKELVEMHGADVNILTNSEEPYANRTALFFALARVMPTVVEYLVQAGAFLDIKATGPFRLVSDPSKSFRGSFSPLSFVQQLQAEESALGALPPYWASKLNVCIQILSKATMERIARFSLERYCALPWILRPRVGATTSHPIAPFTKIASPKIP
jgi:hypothetical protein